MKPRDIIKREKEIIAKNLKREAYLAKNAYHETKKITSSNAKKVVRVGVNIFDILKGRK